MIKINLLPVRAAKKKETFMNQIYVGILVLALTFAGVGWRAYSMKAEIADKGKQIQDREKELADLKETVKKVEEFEAKKQVLQQKIDLITDLEQGREQFIQVVDTLSQAIPGGVWVTGVAFKGKGKGKAKGPSGVSLKGSAYEKEDVGIFIANLKAQKDFISDVSLGSLSAGRGMGVGAVGSSVYNYDITVFPKQPEKAQVQEDQTSKKRKKK